MDGSYTLLGSWSYNLILAHLKTLLIEWSVIT
jgi:hypothetical protein